MTEDEIIVDVKNLEKNYSSLEVIKGISFSVHKGQVLGILGALTLYLDFVNLFLHILRFLGKKK